MYYKPEAKSIILVVALLLVTVYLPMVPSTTASSFDGVSWLKYADENGAIPVVDVGDPSHQDNTWVGGPSVIIDNDAPVNERYKMWYYGADTRDFHGQGTFYATSPDGILWTKYTDSSGAAVPVLEPGPSGSYDEDRAAVGTVIKEGSIYKMWYSGIDGSNKARTLYATSSDGISWTKQGVVLDIGASGERDDTYAYSPRVITDLNAPQAEKYKMWYTGKGSGTGGQYKAFYAVSPDGLSWTKYSDSSGAIVVIDSGGLPSGLDDKIAVIHSIFLEEMIYKAWYTGYDSIGIARIFYTESIDGKSWYKHSLALDVGSPGDLDHYSIHLPCVLKDETGTYHMWYEGVHIESAGTVRRIFYAHSNILENLPPVAEAGLDQTVFEGDVVQFNGSTSYDSDGTIETYEWDFDSNNGLWWETGALPDATGPTPTNVYGDDSVNTATLRVTDDKNLTDTDTCIVTVLNVDPTVTIDSVTMDVEIGLRVAGRKYNDVGMTLYENGNPIGYISIERLPGSPDDQMAWIPLSVDWAKSYSATVTYTPEDPPNIGSNPVWIYMKLENGSIKKIHHTFNVQQSMKRDSEHWNHIEPWEVDLSAHFIGLPFEITSHITDPGSDDEYLTYTYGSQIVNVTYLNNPPFPDPYPSPEIIPVDRYDTTFLLYEGPGTISLTVTDDDGGAVFQVINIL